MVLKPAVEFDAALFRRMLLHRSYVVARKSGGPCAICSLLSTLASFDTLRSQLYLPQYLQGYAKHNFYKEGPCARLRRAQRLVVDCPLVELVAQEAHATRPIRLRLIAG